MSECEGRDESGGERQGFADLRTLLAGVDPLCIDQEDAKEKHIKIVDMDSIYAGASLTIISAAGDASSHGLPGGW